MVAIGNFFFKHRNWLFIVFYAALFLPSPSLIPASLDFWSMALGLIITIAGQLIRGLTIGLAYIVRGGKEGKPYADGLVTEGIFRHCRNPLYVGNILMLLGVGILANSLFYIGIMIPLFLFIYQAIVLAEEDFLRKKFGPGFDAYCQDVNRWLPRIHGLSKTLSSMEFNWKRWILKEHTTQFIWLIGITLLLLFNHPQLTDNNSDCRNAWLIGTLSTLTAIYLLVRVLKKTGRFKAE
jgi:hypothetical protein